MKIKESLQSVRTDKSSTTTLALKLRLVDYLLIENSKWLINCDINNEITRGDNTDKLYLLQQLLENMETEKSRMVYSNR